MTGTRSLDPSGDERAETTRFAALRYLFAEPKRARLYTDLFLNGPTTVAAATDRLSTPRRSAAYDYLSGFEEHELVVDDDGTYDATAAVFPADEQTPVVSPVDVAAYGAAAVDEELAAFLDRRSLSGLFAAVQATIAHHAGNTTRRGTAESIGVEPGEAVVVTERLDGVVALLAVPDPTIDASRVAVDARLAADAPYELVEE